MSKNVVIQEGGAGKQMTVHKLRTNLVEGGTCLWVPEDETRLVTKTVTENGTYTATEDSAYGYSVVNVRVAGGNGSANPDGTPSTSTVSPGGSGSAVVGRDPTTGNDFAVGVDENGDLVETLVPSSLEVTRPPTRVGYADGDTIDYSGIEARLLCGDGTVFTDEEHPDGYTLYKDDLTFPVTTADASGASDMHASSDLDVGATQPLLVGTYAYRKSAPSSTNRYYSVDKFTGDARFCVVAPSATSRSVLYVMAGAEGGAVTYTNTTYKVSDDSIINERTETKTLSRTYTYNGKTVHYFALSSSDANNGEELYPYNQGAVGDNAGRVAWTLYFGEVTGGTVDVPVQWTSTFDGRTFEDSVQLHVTSSSGGDSGTTSGGDSGSGDIGGNDGDFSGGGGGF